MGSLEQKKAIVAETVEKLEKAQSVVFADYRGMTVKEITELRAALRKQGVELKVLKNTLIKIAADQNGVEGLDPFLVGTNMWAFSMEDAVSAAKLLQEFAKTHPNLVIKGGIMDKKAFGEEGVKALASLPSREALLGQIAGLLQSPIAGMARVLQGPINKMAYALEAYRKAQENGQSD